MYVTKLDKGSMLSCGKTFVEGKREAVSSKDFAYLKNTFPNSFKFEGDVPIEDAKTEPKKVRKPRAKKAE